MTRMEVCMALGEGLPPLKATLVIPIHGPGLSAEVLKVSCPCYQQQWPLEGTLVLYCLYLFFFSPSPHFFPLLPVITFSIGPAVGSALGELTWRFHFSSGSQWRLVFASRPELNPSPRKTLKSLHSISGSSLSFSEWLLSFMLPLTNSHFVVS